MFYRPVNQSWQVAIGNPADLPVDVIELDQQELGMHVQLLLSGLISWLQQRWHVTSQ